MERQQKPPRPTGADAHRARGRHLWPRVPEEGAELWEHLPTRPGAAVTLRNVTCPPQPHRPARHKPFPGELLGRCFRRRSDCSSRVCAFVLLQGHEGNDSRWKRSGTGQEVDPLC